MEKIDLVKCVMTAAKAVGIAQMVSVDFRKEASYARYKENN